MNKQKMNALNMIDEWAKKIVKESEIMNRHLDAYKEGMGVDDFDFDVSEVRKCIGYIADYASDLKGQVKIIKEEEKDEGL